MDTLTNVEHTKYGQPMDTPLMTYIFTDSMDTQRASLFLNDWIEQLSLNVSVNLKLGSLIMRLP